MQKRDIPLSFTTYCFVLGSRWLCQTQDDLKLVDPGGFKLCNGDAVNGQ